MARDSLGPIGKSLTTTRAETSQLSVIDSALRAKVGKPLTREALANQMARLEAAWGPPKNRTTGQMAAMADEWFHQLNKFGERSVELAVTHVLGANRFEWLGALAEVFAFCNRDHSEWREVVMLQLPKPSPEQPEPFARDGRTVAEEIAHRTQQIAEMKKRHGYKLAAEIVADEIAARTAKQEIPLAPVASDASPALFETKLVRELRRKQGLVKDGPAN